MINIFWFRRDLRLEDNHGLFLALNDDLPVLPIFIFDTNILEDLQDKSDARISFIHAQLEKISTLFASKGKALRVFHTTPEAAFKQLLEQYKIAKVYTNTDYEPSAITRDIGVGGLLKNKGVAFQAVKDQVIFHRNEVLKKDATPYTVFTPHSKLWHNNLTPTSFQPFKSKELLDKLLIGKIELPSLRQLGFQKSTITVAKFSISETIKSYYKENRDFRAIEGTSRLSVHLRFGTVGIRTICKAVASSPSLLNELIWREFYMQILYHFPRVVAENFKVKYNAIEWRNNENEFERWCAVKQVTQL